MVGKEFFGDITNHILYSTLDFLGRVSDSPLIIYLLETKRMKNLIKNTVRSFFRIVFLIFNYESLIRWKHFKNTLYSYWIMNSFRKLGKAFYVQAPIYLKGGNYISIGDNFFAHSRLRIEAFDEYKGSKYTPEIIIGDNVVFNPDCHIGCINRIEIGNNVLFASKVFIEDCYHGEIDKSSLEIPPHQRKLYSKGPVVIEDNVWIGEGVAILPDVRIGKNSIIGANAVVTKSFPPNSIIGGNPARIIKLITE
jgi:acetyltransferase-like isoleucine patch superfamily enzyme